jgi:hypothetical protein
VRELLQTNDLVRLSWLKALLTDSGIETVVLDSHMSTFLGSTGAVRQRLMVDDEDYLRARRILAQAGESLPDE